MIDSFAVSNSISNSFILALFLEKVSFVKLGKNLFFVASFRAFSLSLHSVNC